MSDANGSPAAPVTDDEAKKKRLNNAVVFLRNPQVRASPLARRVNFLKSKGLPAEEIFEAFTRVGQPQTLQAIQDIISGKTAPIATGVAASTASSAPHPAAPTPVVVHAPPPPLPGAPPAATVQYVYALPPPTAPIATPSSYSWKDYFIGTTLAAVGTAAAVKAFTTFSPYQLVRKDEQPQLPFRQPSARFVDETRSPLPQVQPLPLPIDALVTSGSVTMSQGATRDAKDDEISQLKQFLEESQKQCADAKADLDKVRREKAEMAVTVGKLKGQVATLTRAAERAESTLEARVQQKLDEAKGRDAQAAANTFPDGALPVPAGTEAIEQVDAAKVDAAEVA